MKTKDDKKLRTAGRIALTAAVITLFNPNINLIDILPDFIGFFILARFFERAQDSAPYFEEARVNFTRLAYLSLAKIPALFVILFARSGNTTDNDIVVLMTLIFGIFEGLLSVMAVRDIFNALTYLGQRTDASVLLKCRGMKSADELKNLSIVFFIAKCALYTLPELMKLTRTKEIGGQTVVIYGSREYPFVLIAALTVGLVIGIIWLHYILRYIKDSSTCNFNDCLASVGCSYREDEYERKRDKRRTYLTFRILALSSVLTLTVAFSNLYDVNLLPRPIYAVILTVGLARLAKHNGRSKNRVTAILLFGALYTVCALAFYTQETSFLLKHGYDSLYFAKPDHDSYISYFAVELLAIPEFIMHAVMTLLFFLEMKKYTEGIKAPQGGPDFYSRQDRDYHRSLTVKTAILASLSLLTGIGRLADVMINANIVMLATNSSNLEIQGILAPAIPWFGSLVMAFTVIHILYSYYYFSVIKDEIEPT